MFDCAEYHSEFNALEVKRHELLTDKFCLHFFELPKIPETVSKNDGLELWLALFNAKTEEELKQIEALELPIMNQVIGAYRHITATDEFKEMERLRSRAQSNEVSALGHARCEGYREAEEKLQGVISEQAAEIAKLRAQLEG